MEPARIAVDRDRDVARAAGEHARGGRSLQALLALLSRLAGHALLTRRAGRAIRPHRTGLIPTDQRLAVLALAALDQQAHLAVLLRVTGGYPPFAVGHSRHGEPAHGRYECDDRDDKPRGGPLQSAPKRILITNCRPGPAMRDRVQTPGRPALTTPLTQD